MDAEHAKNLHLISDSTGETLQAVARASLARFADAAPRIHVAVFVRNANDLDAALAGIRKDPGLVIHTLVDNDLREALNRACEELGVKVVAALDPVIGVLSEMFDQIPADQPGMQHRVNSQYFDRIGALDFAISHDDGALGARLALADVILTGVSRTSKTPTCIYLAYRGIKAANIPLVPNIAPDPAFTEAMARGVPTIGLTASPSRLSQIRRQRLETIGATESRSADYAEIDQIRAEVAEARLFFDQHNIPVIDVTRRSIEETAAAILAILRMRGVDPL